MSGMDTKVNLDFAGGSAFIVSAPESVMPIITAPAPQVELTEQISQTPEITASLNPEALGELSEIAAQMKNFSSGGLEADPEQISSGVNQGMDKSGNVNQGVDKSGKTPNR